LERRLGSLEGYLGFGEIHGTFGRRFGDLEFLTSRLPVRPKDNMPNFFVKCMSSMLVFCKLLAVTSKRFC
jgi:hypothetical protein